MTAPPRQLVLDLAHRSALGAEDFLVSRSNAAAVDLVDRWPAWPHWAALVVGPAGSGKTHLANVWQLRSGAEAIAAARLSEAAVAELSGRSALAVEDLDRGIAEERVLFHLLTLAREHKLALETRLELLRRRRIRLRCGSNHLDGEADAQLVIERLVDGAHASGAEQFENRVARADLIAGAKTALAKAQRLSHRGPYARR